MDIVDLIRSAGVRLAAGDTDGADTLYRRLLAQSAEDPGPLSTLLQTIFAAEADSELGVLGQTLRSLADLRKQAAAPQMERMRERMAAADQALSEALIAGQEAVAADPVCRAEVESTAWAIQKRRGHFPLYFSAFGQDHFIFETVFGRKRGGIFVDLGAFDGIEGSNTLFFEKFAGWTGLCVEPDPTQFARLTEVRSAPCLQTCVGGSDGMTEFIRVREGMLQMGGIAESYDPEVLAVLRSNSTIETIRIPCKRLGTLLMENGLTAIDYLSIDTEGAELAILGSHDFDRFPIGAISVENNRQSPEIGRALARNGYDFACRLGVDDIFVRSIG